MTLGTIEFPSSYFEGVPLEPGHTVIVRNGERKVKVMAHMNDMLKSDEACVTPGVGWYLRLKEGDTVEVLDKITIGEKVFDEVDHVDDLVKKKAHHIREEVMEDLEAFYDRTVGEVLEHFGRKHVEESKGYLEVPPNPDDFGVEPEDVYDDPSKDEKIWSPDEDGDGKVRIFKPEVDED
jgi:hypothetical protein